MNWTEYGSEKANDIVSCDVECFYDKSRGISLSVLPIWKYVDHPETFPYLISFHTEGWSWVGDPKEFTEWGRLDGKTVAMHNASFDGLVWRRLVRDGVVPGSCQPARFLCTADLASYLRLSRRSLAFTVKSLYGVELEKQTRDDAEGRTAADMKRDPEFWARMLAYGASDAEWCWRIAVDHGGKFPARYQRVSEKAREAAWEGVPIDAASLSDALGLLETRCHEFLKLLPWYPDMPALSTPALRAHGRACGISVPGSLAKESPAGREFFETYGPKFPWVRAVRDYRQANMMLSKCRNLEAGLTPANRFPYSAVFFGANTGRFTAGVKRGGDDDREDSNKFNLLNLPREPLQGVDLRGMIVPPKGHKLFVGDYAQVEPRILLHAAGDLETLRLIQKDGLKIYEAMAIRLFGLAPEQAKGLKNRDPQMYATVKGMTLGFGYGMGEKKFVLSAPKYTDGKYCPTLDQAREAKYKYRATNPLVVALWRRHQSALLSSAVNRDATHRIELPSGRWLEYYDPIQAATKDDDTGEPRMELLVRQTYGDEHKRIYGAKCVENYCQATSFDVLVDALCAVWDAGYHVPFSLYDEIIAYVPDDDPERHGRELARLMVSSSPWAADIPLDVEWHIVDRYFK